eukprot:1192388-Karenia_brevis.AAC.1
MVLKGSNMTNDARLQAIVRLMKESSSQEEQEQLESGKSMLCGTSPGSKLNYLLTTKDSFALLKAWFPTDQRLCLKWYVAGTKLKEANVHE